VGWGGGISSVLGKLREIASYGVDFNWVLLGNETHTSAIFCVKGVASYAKRVEALDRIGDTGHQTSEGSIKRLQSNEYAISSTQHP